MTRNILTIHLFTVQTNRTSVSTIPFILIEYDKTFHLHVLQKQSKNVIDNISRKRINDIYTSSSSLPCLLTTKFHFEIRLKIMAFIFVQFSFCFCIVGIAHRLVVRNFVCGSFFIASSSFRLN